MDPNDIDVLSSKVGGRFNLVTLFCMRLRDLQSGLPALIEDSDELSDKELVTEEIRQGKVWLAFGDEAEEIRKIRYKEVEKLPRPAEAPAETAPKSPF